MLIDHIGAMFFPDVYWLRTIGRIAFPLYALMIVEGCIHEEKKDKGLLHYIGFLSILSIVSEFGYDYDFFDRIPFWDDQNQIIQYLTFVIGYALVWASKTPWTGLVIWPLVVYVNHRFVLGYRGAGIVFMLILLWYCKKLKEKSPQVRALVLFMALTVLLLGEYFEVYYRYYGFKAITMIIEPAFSDAINMGVYLALPFLFLYDFTYGNPSKGFRLFYRFFYPLHLTALALCKYIFQ